jgi:hypothetical protein
MMSGVLLVAGCAGSPTDNTAAIDRACSVADCFLERDVRDFEVIDQTTLIVYVGSQRCAFQVELRGTFCDMTFAPEIFFYSPGDLQEGKRPGDEIFGSQLGDRGLRICANDLQIDVDGGAFTESQPNAQPTDRYGNRRSQCQVTGVASLTDDQLVELYVARGLVPPPPPMGSGEIEVGDQEEEVNPITPPEPADRAETTSTQSSVPFPSAATAASAD